MWPTWGQSSFHSVPMFDESRGDSVELGPTLFDPGQIPGQFWSTPGQVPSSVAWNRPDLARDGLLCWHEVEQRVVPSSTESAKFAPKLGSEWNKAQGGAGLFRRHS